MTAPDAGAGSPPVDADALDVVVVGGGQAGLAMAWHLLQRGLRFVVLESAAEFGHTWRSRWDSLTLFTPAQFDSLPGLPFPAAADTYPGRDDVADYLTGYAKAFELPVRLNARVTSLTRADGGFDVRTADDKLRARQVVVASGPFQTPYVPPAAGGFDPSVTQLHSAAYRNPKDLPDGPALVVGAGNSGLQIAEELIASRPVTVAVGTSPPMLPQRFLGRGLFWWLTRSHLLQVPGETRLGRRAQARGEFVIGTNRRRLRQAGVKFRPRLTGAAGRTARFADDGTLEVAAVIWATGYRNDYSWIHIPGVVEGGRVAHRRGVTEVAGLYFLGLSWQHTRASALLGFVGEDAAYVVDRIVSARR